MDTEHISYHGPMSEHDYLDVVEHIQKAMAIEPFRPPLVDVLMLLSDWRDLTRVVDAARERRPRTRLPS
jgi:hypothetical protein